MLRLARRATAKDTSPTTSRRATPRPLRLNSTNGARAKTLPSATRPSRKLLSARSQFGAQNNHPATSRSKPRPAGRPGYVCQLKNMSHKCEHGKNSDICVRCHDESHDAPEATRPVGRPPLAGESATGQIQLRVTLARKNAYVRAARPQKLTAWIFAQLDKAAGYPKI